jgi:hypothetical protein
MVTFKDYYKNVSLKDSTNTKKYSLPKIPSEEKYTRESELQSLIIDYCKAKGLWYCRIEGGGKLIHGSNGTGHLIPSAMKGMPDLVLCLDGCFCAAELKLPTGKLDTEQARRIGTLNAAGGQGAVITSLAGFLLFLDGIPAKVAVDTAWGMIPVY